MNENQDLTFDRYTEPARLALFYARVALSEHGGTAIADAHLLLGIFKAAPELGPLMGPTVNIQQLSECVRRPIFFWLFLSSRRAPPPSVCAPPASISLRPPRPWPRSRAVVLNEQWTWMSELPSSC